jgi:hypothetical protein
VKVRWTWVDPSQSDDGTSGWIECISVEPLNGWIRIVTGQAATASLPSERGMTFILPARVVQFVETMP